MPTLLRNASAAEHSAWFFSDSGQEAQEERLPCICLFRKMAMIFQQLQLVMSTIEQNSIVGGPCLLLLPKKRVCQGRQVLREIAFCA